jgi:hypothetical protein
MKKNLLQGLMKLFLKKKARADQTPPDQDESADNSEVPLNKFGKPESLVDQCEHHTCTCSSTECKIDDQLFYESVLLMDYVRRMKKVKGELE